MDERTYQQGIAVLSMSGLKIDEASVEFFWQRLRKMNGGEFLEAIGTNDGSGIGLINDPNFKTWYGNENVPLLIMEKQKEIKAERNKLRRKQADEQRKLEWEKNASPPPKGFKLPDFYKNQIPQLEEKNVKSK
jgi:hypothetical protein